MSTSLTRCCTFCQGLLVWYTVHAIVCTIKLWHIFHVVPSVWRIHFFNNLWYTAPVYTTAVLCTFRQINEIMFAAEMVARSNRCLDGRLLTELIFSTMTHWLVIFIAIIIQSVLHSKHHCHATRNGKNWHFQFVMTWQADTASVVNNNYIFVLVQIYNNYIII